ncbi:MAG: BNR-4 repeat-containing protein [bacterium]|nr:BNR-4 repeat-containing protein [bacterium]
MINRLIYPIFQKVSSSQVRDYANITWLKVILMAAVCLAFTGESFGEDMTYSLDDAGKIVFSQNTKVNDDVAGHRTGPSLKVGPEGNIYVVWEDGRNDVGDIYFTVSTDGGRTFNNEDIRINDDDVKKWQSSPGLAVDGKGNIYVVWEDDRDDFSDIYFARSMDKGRTFSKNKKVYERGTNPSITVDQEGRIYIAWRAHSNQIFFASSDDKGESFSPTIKVTDVPPAGGMPDMAHMAVNKEGGIYIVWWDLRYHFISGADIYFAYSNAGGKTFSQNIRVNDDEGRSDQIFPSIVVDENGIIYITWIDDRDGFPGIYMTRSVDGGQTFEENRKIIEEGMRQTLNIWKGNIYLAWSGPGNYYWRNEIYFAYSRDEARTFSEAIRVNDESKISVQSYPSLSVDAKGAVYIAWSDHREEYINIYFSKGVFFHSIRGQVVTAESKGLPDVTLTLSGLESETYTITDEGGCFEFPEVEREEYKLTPAADGFEFSPPYLEYMPLMADQEGQDFTAIPVKETLAYPNPFYPENHRICRIGRMPLITKSVKIYTTVGELVRVIDEDEMLMSSEGDSKFAEWDGRNEGGAEVTSGVYIYLVNYNIGEQKGKIGLIR